VIQKTAADLPPASPNFRPLASRSTSGSWLVSFARRDQDRPLYWLKVPKAVRTIPPSRRKIEQLSPDLEYRTAVAFREYFADFPEFSNSIPQPVQFLPDCDGIVMEYRTGRHLKDELFVRGNVLSSTRTPKSLSDISAACGRWLRLLHEMKPPEWLPEHVLDSTELARRTVQAASLLRPELARHVPLDTLLRWIDRADISGRRSAVSHGDFQPGNVLVSGSQLSVIDLATAGVRPPEDDIGFFITFTFTHKERIAFGNAAGTRGFVKGFCDSFLRGYGFDSPAGKRSLRPYIAWLIVQRLADVSARIDRWPGVGRFVLRKRLVTWVRSELPLFMKEFA
jgi:hypothetical protein